MTGPHRIGLAVLTSCLLLVGYAGYELRTSASLSILVRNTPSLERLAGHFVPAPPPIGRSVEATAGAPQLTGALYRPDGRGPFEGVLLVNGAEVPGGWQNPDVVTFARSIAGLNVELYVPDLPGGLEQGTATIDTLQALEADTAWFSAQLDGRPVSLVGICVGASFAMIVAAHQPERVRAVMGLDPYASVADLLEAATTASGPQIDGRPGPFDMVPWVRADVVRSVIRMIPDSASRAQLGALEATATDEPLRVFQGPPPNGLSDSGQAVWRLLANRDVRQFDALYEALPDVMRSQMRAWSPLEHVSALQAPVLVAAPFDDFAFPAGESTKLQQARQDVVHVTRSSALDHVSPAFGPRLLIGYWQLWQFATASARLIATSGATP